MDIKNKIPFILIVTDTAYILWQGAKDTAPIFIQESPRNGLFPWDDLADHNGVPLKIMIATSNQTFEEMDIRHLPQRSKGRLRHRIKNAGAKDTAAHSVLREVLLQDKESYLLIGCPVSKEFADFLDELVPFWQGDITLSSLPAEIVHHAKKPLLHTKAVANILVIRIAETLFHVGVYKGHMKMLRAFSYPKNADALAQDLADTTHYFHHTYRDTKAGVRVIGLDALPKAFPDAQLILRPGYLGHAPLSDSFDWDHVYIEKISNFSQSFTKFMWGPLVKKRRQQQQQSLLKFGSYGLAIASLIISTALFINGQNLVAKSEKVHQKMAALAPHLSQPVSTEYPGLSFAAFQKMKDIQEVFNHRKQAPDPSHMLATLHETLGGEWYLKTLTWENTYQAQMAITLSAKAHPLPPAAFETLLQTLKDRFTQYDVIVESSPFQSTERETYQVTKKPSYLHAIKLRFVKKGKNA